MGLGPTHTVDLRKARDKAPEYRRQLFDGTDRSESGAGAPVPAPYRPPSPRHKLTSRRTRLLWEIANMARRQFLGCDPAALPVEPRFVLRAAVTTRIVRCHKSPIAGLVLVDFAGSLDKLRHAGPEGHGSYPL